MSRVTITHYSDNKMKTVPVIFKGRPGRAIAQYVNWLDEQDKDVFFNKLKSTLNWSP